MAGRGFRRCCDSPAQKGAKHVKGCVNYADPAVLYVVVQRDYVGYEDGYSLSAILGPYSKDEADARAEELRDRDMFGQEFDVRPLTTRHHTDDWGK